MTPGIGCSAKPDAFDPYVPIPGSNGSAANQVGITQLCNVIEMVRNDLEIDIPRAWVSHTKLNLMERTAQFRETAGDTARHAKAKGKPPKKPIPLLDAQQIVRQILIRWVQYRSSSEGRR